MIPFDGEMIPKVERGAFEQPFCDAITTMADFDMNLRISDEHSLRGTSMEA